MEGKKRKKTGLPGLSIFKKLTSKSKSSLNTYHTAAPVDDLDLSSENSPFEIMSSKPGPKIVSGSHQICSSTVSATWIKGLHGSGDLAHGYNGHGGMTDRCCDGVTKGEVDSKDRGTGDDETGTPVHTGPILNAQNGGNKHMLIHTNYFGNSTMIDLDDPANQVSASICKEVKHNGRNDATSSGNGTPVIVKNKSSNLKKSPKKSPGSRKTQDAKVIAQDINDASLHKPDVNNKNRKPKSNGFLDERSDQSSVIRSTPPEDDSIIAHAGKPRTASQRSLTPSLHECKKVKEAPRPAVNNDGACDDDKLPRLFQRTMVGNGVEETRACMLVFSAGDGQVNSPVLNGQVNSPVLNGQVNSPVLNGQVNSPASTGEKSPSQSSTTPCVKCSNDEDQPVELKNVKFEIDEAVDDGEQDGRDSGFMNKTDNGLYYAESAIDCGIEVTEHRGQPTPSGHKHINSDCVDNPCIEVVSTNRIKSTHRELNNRSPNHNVCQTHESVRDRESTALEYVPVLDTTALELFSEGPSEDNFDGWMKHAKWVTMSRRVKSLDNMLDDGQREPPAWLFTGSNDNLSITKKKDKSMFLKNKIKGIRKLFTKPPSKTGDNLSISDRSPSVSPEHQQFQFQRRNSQPKKQINICLKGTDSNVKVSMGTNNVNKHPRCHLHASRDSGFDQRSGGTMTSGHTDHDFLSSASEVKDSSHHICKGDLGLSSHNINSDFIPGYGKPCVKFSMENILDRCKSFESLSSDDESYLNLRSRSKTHRRFSSHHDLYRPKSRSRSHQRQSSCDNLHTSTPNSRAVHDVSKFSRNSQPRKSRTLSIGSESDSSYYGIPIKDSSNARIYPDSSDSPERMAYSRRNYRKKMPRSGSGDILPADGATNRRAQHRIRRSRPIGSDDWPSLSSGDQDKSVSWKQRKNWVSMAASAAYIPGASLSDKLRLAASKGQVDKVHELIKTGATFQPDREGRTALHYASLNGQGEVVQILADEGADINAQDSLGYTALHRAAAQGHLEVIKVLLVEGCLVDRQDEVHGNSPLHEASWNGYSKTLELLIRHKANVHCINKAGFTALHLAAQNGHNQSARVLLYAGCNPDMRNNYGDTALHTAARYGHAGVTRILISARCNISEQNKNGDTGLHIAAALKRRKLTKLLVESGINTNLKNKQNETAIDVARRKEHPEIILLITAHPTKNGKKQKKNKDKNKKEKGSKLALNKEEPEKKGLFFRKKTKAKVSEAEKKAAEANIKPPDYAPVAGSEASSSEFNSQMAPEDLLRGFRHHQVSRPKESHHDSHGASARGTTTRGQKKVQGLVTEYASKSGVQYYKDLAGNVRQGPIGYAPICNCQPVIKKIEKRMEADRNNLYDHIDASHRTLADRIETLDKRTTQQVCSVDKVTKERLEADRHDREEYVRSCIRKDHMEMQENCEHRHVEMKQDLHGYLDNRFTNFERYYAVTANRRDPCYWCHGREHQNKPHYHDDDMLNQNNMVYDPEEPPMPGRLYKSRSDETLSVTSSHPSRRHWKLRANVAARDITDLKLAHVADKARRLERKIRSKSAGVSARAPSMEQLSKVRDSSVPVHRHSHVPEGNSGSNLHCEYQTYKDYVDKQHQWNTKRHPVDTGMTQHFSQPPQESQSNYNSLRRGNSQEVKAEVHQSRPRSASQTNNPVPVTNGLDHVVHYGSSTRDLYNNETTRVRSGSENTRMRSSSATRASDASRRPLSQHLPTQLNSQQSQSTYSMGGNQQTGQGIPHSASYDSSTTRQQQPQRYTQHAPQPTPNPSVQGQLHPPAHPQGRVGPEPPARSSSQLTHPQHPITSTTTPTPTHPHWTPLHTSSPDTPSGTYNSPNNHDSLISSQKSSPLYPSPNHPQMTRSESSSNPDSGYGSRLFGGRQVSGPRLPGSTSSSFQSHEHNSSLSTNHSSVNGGSPLVQYNREPLSHRPATFNGDGQASTNPTSLANTGQQLQKVQQLQQSQKVQQQQRTSIPGIVNRWYDAKLRDPNPHYQENTRMWPPTRTTRSSQGQNIQNEPPHYNNSSSNGIIGKATQV